MNEQLLQDLQHLQRSYRHKIRQLEHDKNRYEAALAALNELLLFNYDMKQRVRK